MILLYRNKKKAIACKKNCWSVINGFKSRGFKRSAFVEMCVAQYPDLNNVNGRDYLRGYWQGKVDVTADVAMKINKVYATVIAN